MTVDIRSDGLNFDPPTVAFEEPQTIGRRLVSSALALVAGFVFVRLLMLSVAIALEATKIDAYFHVVNVTARELDAAFATARCVFFTTARVATKQVIHQTLHVVAFFEDM